MFCSRHVDGDRTNHAHLRPLICVAFGMEVVGWLFWVLVGRLLFCLCFWVVGCLVYLGFIFGCFFALWSLVDCFGLHFCCWLINSQVFLLSIL